MSDEERPIIIKKIFKASHGSHGGAWKIAYADFVTAMMAFFLLMWLVSATTEEQKLGIADYFRPTIASTSDAGANSVLAGRSIAEDGAQSSGSVMITIPNTPPQIDNPDSSASDSPTESKPEYDVQLVAEREEEMFLEAEIKLKEAINHNPDLRELDEHIIIDRTTDGLRIQIVDREGRSIFRSGSAVMNDHGRKILRQVAKVIAPLPNRISISGHTDAAGLRGRIGYSNWELSSDRANSSRRELLAGGLPRPRIYQVTGKAATEPLLPDDPYGATNRRITILLMREAPVLPPSYSD